MSRNPYNPQFKVITGASAGLGAALTKARASPGHRLGLFGQSESRLTSVADERRRAGARVMFMVTGVTASQVVEKVIPELDHERPIHLQIANAGVFDGHGPHRRREHLEEIDDHNLSNPARIVTHGQRGTSTDRQAAPGRIRARRLAAVGGSAGKQREQGRCDGAGRGDAGISPRQRRARAGRLRRSLPRAQIAPRLAFISPAISVHSSATGEVGDRLEALGHDFSHSHCSQT